MQGHKTTVLGDVATNLVTNLLLGNDWIRRNNVILDSPQQQIYLTDRHRRILATAPFIQPQDLRSPVLLTNDVTLSPHSEAYIDVHIQSSTNAPTEVLFEPAPNFCPKQILLINVLLELENNQSKILIINANDRHRTLSKNTKLGYISCQSETDNHLISPVLFGTKNYVRTSTNAYTYHRNVPLVDRSCSSSPKEKRKVQYKDFTWESKHINEQQHKECYVCQEHFLSRNDLQRHLREKCYPQDIREKIERWVRVMVRVGEDEGDGESR
jgi:hypothetical protein